MGAAADLEGELAKIKLKALAAAGSAMKPKKLKPLVLAALQRLPASLVQISSGVKCDCLCPVPGHPTLTAGDCGEVARIEFDEAEANAKLSAASELCSAVRLQHPVWLVSVVAVPNRPVPTSPRSVKVVFRFSALSRDGRHRTGLASDRGPPRVVRRPRAVVQGGCVVGRVRAGAVLLRL